MATIRSAPLPKPEKAPVHKFALCAGIVAHAGALLAFVPAFFDWWAVLGCFALMYFTGAIGISATYHRLLTHRSYSVRPRWFEYVLTIIGNLTMQGGALSWVADHRRHHAHTDEPLDVHTPRHGFWWSHIIWVITPEITAVHTTEYDEKWAPDLMKDPVHRFLNTWWFVFPIALLGVLYGLGGMPWLIWGGFVRTVLILHVTLLVNSATHRWGYRTYDTRDDSTNLWWVALLVVRRGVAQQPPRLPVVGEDRPAVVGDRHRVLGDQGDVAGRDRVQRQAAEAHPGEAGPRAAGAGGTAARRQ